MHITNTSKQPLTVGGVVLSPGISTPVPTWDVELRNPIIAAWKKERVLVESAPPVLADAKDELIARLKTYGIVRTRRVSEASLRQTLAYAETRDAVID
jgi:hypothetical protein